MSDPTLSLVDRPEPGVGFVCAQLAAMINGGSVQRYHTVRTIQPDTVGHHSFGVAWLCWLLTDGSASRDLFIAALAHDLAEQWTGDIPAPAKRKMGIRTRQQEVEDASMKVLKLPVPELQFGEGRILKLADAMHGMIFCVTEREMGNTGIEPVYENFNNYTTELLNDPATSGREVSVFNAITAMWRNRRVS